MNTFSNFYKAVREAAKAVIPKGAFRWGSPFDFEQASGEMGGYIFAEWAGGTLNTDGVATKLVTMYFLDQDYHGNVIEPIEWMAGSQVDDRETILANSEAMALRFMQAFQDWIAANNGAGIGMATTGNTTPELLAFTGQLTGYAITLQFTIAQYGCEEFTPFTKPECKPC